MTRNKCLRLTERIFLFLEISWGGRMVCLFLCVVGIGLYAIPTGALFDAFGALVMEEEDDDEEED